MCKTKAGAVAPKDIAKTLLIATDGSGSVLVGHSPGERWHTGYSPYGFQAGPPPLQPRSAFNGQLREPQGWYHLGHGHRVYNPVLRRFHSPDRLSPFARGGLNTYTYCLGDPVNHVDPTGRAANFMQVATLVGIGFGLLTGATALLGPLVLKGAASSGGHALLGGILKGLTGPSGWAARYAAKQPGIGLVAPGGLDALSTVVGMVATVPLGINTIENINDPMNATPELALAASILTFVVAPVKLLTLYTPVLPTSDSALRFSRLVHGGAKVRAAKEKLAQEMSGVRTPQVGQPGLAPAAPQLPVAPPALPPINPRLQSRPQRIRRSDSLKLHRRRLASVDDEIEETSL